MTRAPKKSVPYPVFIGHAKWGSLGGGGKEEEEEEIGGVCPRGQGMHLDRACCLSWGPVILSAERVAVEGSADGAT